MGKQPIQILTVNFLSKQLSIDHPVRVEPDIAQGSSPGHVLVLVLNSLSHHAVTGDHDEQDDQVVGHVTDLQVRQWQVTDELTLLLLLLLLLLAHNTTKAPFIKHVGLTSHDRL